MFIPLPMNSNVNESSNDKPIWHNFFIPATKVLLFPLSCIFPPQHLSMFNIGGVEYVANSEHHNERLTIRRDQCLALNDPARMITQS